MPDYTIRTINSEFLTEVQTASQPDAGYALDMGVRGAVMIAADEIGRGASVSTVEVLVEDAHGCRVRRVAVTLAVAPLALGPATPRASDPDLI